MSTIGGMSFAPDSSEPYKQLAQDKDPARRAQVAADPAAPPELLYYLATDRDELVRTRVADNDATPLQAVGQQAKDESWQVRAALARKVARVMPRLGNTLAARRMLMGALDTLCRDTALEVRQAAIATLQDTAVLPPHLARELAEDSAREVAGPVLRFCLSLSDDDLVDMIHNTKREWVPVEVACRAYLSNSVAQAVWESGNTEAAAVLLGNASADTAPAIIEEATEAAAVEIELQSPLVQNPKLTPAQMERLATFVDGGLLGTLSERVKLSFGESSDVSRVIRRRLDWSEWRKQGGREQERARALFDRGQLDDAAVSDAIAWGERSFVVTALALLAQTEEALVEKVLEHQSPKGITALCWKAGISMRTCRQVQIRTARVPIGKSLNARDGLYYPLPEADMNWQLEFYGII